MKRKLMSSWCIFPNLKSDLILILRLNWNYMQFRYLSYFSKISRKCRWQAGQKCVSWSHLELSNDNQSLMLDTSPHFCLHFIHSHQSWLNWTWRKLHFKVYISQVDIYIYLKHISEGIFIWNVNIWTNISQIRVDVVFLFNLIWLGRDVNAVPEHYQCLSLVPINLETKWW